MNHQTRQELKIVPAQVKVVEHVQHIYSCRHCEKHAIATPIVKAKMPNPVIPKGLTSPSVITFIMIMVQEFADGLPLYRQEKQLERIGIPLNLQTLSNWMISSATRSTIAKKGLNFCNQLFAIERKIKKLDAKERLKIRQKDSQPVLDAYLVWLHEQKEIITPQSATGKAITYSLKQWNKLTTFMKDGRIEIDNNRAERSIKPFVIGRKNWLFAVSTSVANSSAIIYSLVETTKENGLNPFSYLQFLFEELPQLDMTTDLNTNHLMPW